MGQTITKENITSVTNSGLENMGIISQFDTQYQANTKEEIFDRLNRYGICYIPDVLNDQERLNMISGTWDFFEHVTKNELTPISRSDPQTWSSFDILSAGLGMIYHYWNVGHSQHLWDIRQNNKLLQIYSELYDTDPTDLLVSFDGMAFLLPPEQTNEHWHKERDCHLHLDQRLSITERTGFQSYVTAYDIKEGDATIRFLEGSHKYTRKFVQRFGEFTEGDWVIFNEHHLEYYRSKCNEVFLRCPAKSLVLWDSRLVHCGSNPRRNRKNQNIRCIAYVTYAPKETAEESDITIKKKALKEKLTSNHYPQRASYFPTHPSGHQLNEIPAPKLLPIGYSLAGYNDSEIGTIFR